MNRLKVKYRKAADGHIELKDRLNKGSIDRGFFRTTYFSMYEDREESTKVKTSTINSKFVNTLKKLVKEKTDLNPPPSITNAVLAFLFNYLSFKLKYIQGNKIRKKF